MTNITIENIIMTTKWPKILLTEYANLKLHHDNLSSGLAIRSFINQQYNLRRNEKSDI